MKTRCVYKRLSALFAALCVLTFAACEGFIERTITIPDLTVTFDSRGGSECETVKTPMGSSVTLPESNPLPGTELEGYELVGWYADTSGATRIGVAGDEYRVEKSVTMYARWAEKLVVNDEAGDSVIHGIISVRVLVGAGTFTMGSPPNEEGRIYDETQREVTLTKNYWISKYPITNWQFGRSVAAGYENHPVVDVTWQEALDFANSKGGQLPTEAQWEFAARGGNVGKDNGHIYSGGNNLDAVGWYAGNSSEPQKVGQKQPNELGIYDMSGNVFEWVYDWYGYHDDTPVTDPTGPDHGDSRIHRGGSWAGETRECRVADRANSNPEARSGEVGFRVVFIEDAVR